LSAPIVVSVFATPAAIGKSNYDGAWNLTFVTQRGECDPNYNFGINISNGNTQSPEFCEIHWQGKGERRGSCIGDRPRQICGGFRKTDKCFGTGHLERPIGNDALFWSLDGAENLTLRKLGRPLRDRSKRCNKERSTLQFYDNPGRIRPLHDSRFFATFVELRVVVTPTGCDPAQSFVWKRASTLPGLAEK